MAENRAVFLDRDGVIIRNVPYLNDAKMIEFLPKVPECIARINKLGFKCVMVTNQSGIARGLLSIEQLYSINKKIEEYLIAHGARVDAIYYCPHHPNGTVPRYSLTCDCRKPKPGMFRKAAQDLHLDLSSSIMIGDQVIDCEAGKNAGCISYLLDTSNSNGSDFPSFEGLDEAVSFIERHFRTLLNT